jgi:sterol desaturase/sphingolipid hydroxylase (fatty acid hydroxylase superfamily)
MRLGTFDYYVDFFISAVLVAALAVHAVAFASAVQGLMWLAYAAGGAASWTLLEYGVHRFLYHRVPYFRELHDAHHAEPNAHIGAPPVLGIVLIFAVFFAPVVQTSVFAASGLTTGILLGYMAYMLVHHAAHEWKLSPASWLYGSLRHHALHHHHSVECNFGITTAFWDHAFGTAYEARRLEPARP